MSRQALTSGQVARMLNIPSRTIRSYLASGRLQAIQNPITGRWRIGREELWEFMRDNGMNPNHLPRPLRILVIDRDTHTAELVRKALDGSLAIVETEAECASALIKMGSCPPDLVLLDEITAGQNCEPLVDAVRSSERTRHVRILALCMPTSRRLDKPAVHRRLNKPFQVQHLSGELKGALATTISATASA